MAAGVCHWLPATGLVERIVHLAPEPLQQFERCDSDLWFEGVYVARNEESNAHSPVSAMLNGAPIFGFVQSHFDSSQSYPALG
jgi:hypothetical protein